MYLFVYKTTHINGKYYIGRHQTSHINDGYLGSGKWVSSIKDKSTLQREILQEANSIEELKQLEKYYISMYYTDPLCMNYRYGSSGYCSEDQRGEKNQKYDSTVFHFVNLDGREEHLTKYHMGQKYPEIAKPRLSIITTTKKGTARGWYVFGGTVTTAGDRSVYHFKHKNGSVEICTRMELIEKYPHIENGNLCRLVNNQAKSAYGWTIQIN
jgi:hypothetical protein